MVRRYIHQYFLPIVVTFVVPFPALWIIPDAMTLPARASEQVTEAEVAELVSLARLYAPWMPRNFTARIPMYESNVYIRYSTRGRGRKHLVIIFKDLVYVLNDGAYAKRLMVFVPTAFVDRHADGKLELRVRIITDKNRRYVRAQGAHNDQAHYDWAVRTLIDNLRRRLVGI